MDVPPNKKSYFNFLFHYHFFLFKTKKARIIFIFLQFFWLLQRVEYLVHILVPSTIDGSGRTAAAVGGMYPFRSEKP